MPISWTEVCDAIITAGPGGIVLVGSEAEQRLAVNASCSLAVAVDVIVADSAASVELIRSAAKRVGIKVVAVGTGKETNDA